MASNDGPSVVEVWGFLGIASYFAIMMAWWLIKIMFFVVVGMCMGIAWLATWLWDKYKDWQQTKAAEQQAEPIRTHSLKAGSPPGDASQDIRLNIYSLPEDYPIDRKSISDRIEMLKEDLLSLNELHRVNRDNASLNLMEGIVISQSSLQHRLQEGGDHELILRSIHAETIKIQQRMKSLWGLTGERLAA